MTTIPVCILPLILFGKVSGQAGMKPSRSTKLFTRSGAFTPIFTMPPLRPSHPPWFDVPRRVVLLLPRLPQTGSGTCVSCQVCTRVLVTKENGMQLSLSNR
jgi:hypothetical protein